MKEKPSKTDWNRVRRMTDSQIDCSDIPPLDENFWKHAKLVIPENKTKITIFLDTDVLSWLKSKGKGYQTRINSILRTYFRAHTAHTV